MGGDAVASVQRAASAGRLGADTVALRPEMGDDADFLANLFAANAASALALSGAPIVMVDHLASMQMRAQTESYRARFPHARRLIAESDGRAYGRLIVEREERDLYIVDIAVHPDAQNRGFGGATVAAVQRSAAAAGLGVRALVMPHNGPSLAMFRRCGFAETGRAAGPSLELRWTA